MNIPADKNKSVVNRSIPFAALLLIVMRIAGWVIDFFTLTEADRLNAGIFVNSKERDESNQ